MGAGPGVPRAVGVLVMELSGLLRGWVWSVSGRGESRLFHPGLWEQ